MAITLCKFRSKFLKNKVIWDKNSGLWEQNKYFFIIKIYFSFAYERNWKTKRKFEIKNRIIRGNDEKVLESRASN